MSVSTTTNRIPYTGNGAQTVYPYPFKIFVTTDLQVFVAGVLQTLTTHYTVDGAGNPNGGNVTFVTAPANGAAIVIIRVLPATQLTVYPSNDKFPSKVHEDLADRAVMLIQQLAEVDKRTLKLPVTSAFSELGVPDPDIGKFLRWKDATALENASITSGGTLGLPVSFADGGTGASYASRNALVLGLNAAQWKKGADISSAGTITLPNPLDGSLIDITGNTGITAISTTGVAEGTVVGFHFTGTPAITDGASLQLFGRTSYTVTAGDKLYFQLRSAVWVEVARVPLQAAANASKFWRGDGTWAAPTGDFVKGLNMKRHASTATKVTFESALRLVMVDANGGTFVTSNPSTFDVDTATAGPAAGGRDQSGAFGNGATVHVYAIRNGATIAGTVSLTGPTTGPTLPSGYTHWTYLGTFVLVSGSVDFPLFRQRGSWVHYDFHSALLTGGVATAETAITISGYVPSNSLRFQIRTEHSVGTTISADSLGKYRVVTGQDYHTDLLKGTNGGSDSVTTSVIMPYTGNLFYLTSSQATANTVDVWIQGYNVPNGGE